MSDRTPSNCCAYMEVLSQPGTNAIADMTRQTSMSHGSGLLGVVELEAGGAPGGEATGATGGSMESPVDASLLIAGALGFVVGIFFKGRSVGGSRSREGT